jgi:23S rRNA (adenine2503-C2)-methyltransferase
MVTQTRTDIAGVELPELEQALHDLGHPRFHARQIFQWIHKRGVSDFALMSDLSRELRATLADFFDIDTPAVVRREQSADGTAKFLLALADGRRIETVCIPENPADPHNPADADRVTFCVSTQVGCAMRCAFCLTGKMGIDRNLTAGEIAGQVRVLVRELNLPDHRFNIVLMGMGEPLHNYEATMKALRILADEHGMGVSPRRVTLSTVGVLPALERLATEPVMPNLAISLHATTEEQRDLLVPINRKYSIEELLNVCRRFPLKRRERITFEYVMLKDVNDSPEDARRLVRLLTGVKGKVNLLPLNEAAGIPFERPSDAAVNRFARVLSERGVTVSVRKSRGRDIRAACGQLITESSREAAPGRRLAMAMGSGVV